MVMGLKRFISAHDKPPRPLKWVSKVAGHTVHVCACIMVKILRGKEVLT